MTKYILAIIVGWIIIIWWQKLLFADKEYIYDESTWWAFIDDAFASSQKEYKNALLSWEKIDFVSYSLSGARTIHKTINFPKITNNTTNTPSVWDVRKEHASPENWKYLWVFRLSRYYSCDRNQTKRLQFEPLSQRNYRSCMNRQFAWDWDPRKTADGTYLTNEQHANKTVACPRKYMWKTLIVEWYWEYKCNDVGGAIKGARLDIYAGIWNYAVENWGKVPTGKKKIRIK